MKFSRIAFLLLFVAASHFAFGQSLMTYKDSSGNLKPVETLFEWQIKRNQMLDSMQALFGKLPPNPSQPPFDENLNSLPPFDSLFKDTFETHSYFRYDIEITVAEGEDVTAYLYIPKKKNPKGRFPAMVALHETDLIGKKSVDGEGYNINLGYAKELAQRGYVVIAPDYPSFGDQKNYEFKSDRYESGSMKGVFNHIRCVDYLQSRNDVDPERIGVIGHSLGGHNAMYLGAFEPRIKVIVTSCGWTLNSYYNNYNEEMRKKFGSRLWGYAQDRYFPLALTKYGLKLEKMPFDFDDVIALLAPRPFFSSSPIHDANFNVEGVRVGIANASEVYHFLGFDKNLQVRYPVSSHDFPPKVRFEAYEYIDSILKDEK